MRFAEGLRGEKEETTVAREDAERLAVSVPEAASLMGLSRGAQPMMLYAQGKCLASELAGGSWFPARR